MKIIVHAGMHKTGSSSIQDTFANADMGPVEYLPNSTSNHSGLMMLLFMDKVEEFHAFRARGNTRAQLLEERGRALERVTQYFAETRAETVLISAEGISGMSLPDLRRLAEFLHARTSEVKIIAYVRPPCSFMSSAFQQMLKGGAIAKIEPSKLWPHYQRRFDKMFQVFGDHNVTLKPFIRDEMKEGNVVLDMAEFLNVSIKPEDIMMSNESLSLEAVALLYTQRNLGRGMLKGFGRVHSTNNNFIKLLSRIGDRKIAFSRLLLEEVVKAHAGDMDWIENRLGRKLLDLPEPEAGGISSETDLFEIAVQQQDLLDRMIAERFKTASGASQEQVARKLDVLMSSFL